MYATYVRKLADITNLKTLVPHLYTEADGAGADRRLWCPAANISTEALLHAFKSDNVAAALEGNELWQTLRQHASWLYGL